MPVVVPSLAYCNSASQDRLFVGTSLIASTESQVPRTENNNRSTVAGKGFGATHNDDRLRSLLNGGFAKLVSAAPGPNAGAAVGDEL